MTDDETIALRVTAIGGKRHPDEYTVIGRIMKSSGVPSQAPQWWWGFYGEPSLDGVFGPGTDLEDCKGQVQDHKGEDTRRAGGS